MATDSTLMSLHGKVCGFGKGATQKFNVLINVFNLNVSC